MKRFLLTALMVLVCGTAWATNYCNDANAVLCWLFTEGTGTTVADSSAHSHGGTFVDVNKPTWSAVVPSYHTSGTATGSVVADGTNDNNVSIGTLSPMGQVTVIAWVKKKSNNTIDGLVTYSNYGTYQHFRIETSATGQIVYTLGKTDSGPLTVSGSTISDTTTWHMVALTGHYISGVTNSVLIGYFDGVADGTSSMGYFYPDTPGRFQILEGTDFDWVHNSNPADAYVADVAIFSRVLSSTEIADIYNNGLTGSGGGGGSTATPDFVIGTSNWNDLTVK